MPTAFIRLVSAARIGRSDAGQSLTEYALVLALVGLVCVVALTFLGGQVTTPLSTVASTV